jgi:hypothetical protein
VQLNVLTVLHNITDNTELIEVTTTALSAERLLECNLQPILGRESRNEITSITYLNIIDVTAVPCGVEELVAESQN